MKNTNNIKEQVVTELHKPARKKFKRCRVIIKGLNDLWVADLVEMIPYSKINKGYKYILVVINAFSKFVWLEPLKSKKGIDVTSAMKSILLTNKKGPNNLQTDMGREFYNKDFKQLMQEYKINHYSTYSNIKASIVERVNRTLKNKMWRQFSLQGSYKWLDIFKDIVNSYNNTVHSTTGFKPKEVNQKNEKAILLKSYSFPKKVVKPLYKIGDFVRISKYREAFSKGYQPSWSNEIFSIKEIRFTNPPTYILEDQRKELIKGRFYNFEISKVKYPDVYLISKILQKKGTKVKVRYLGLDKSHDEWISKKDLV